MRQNSKKRRGKGKPQKGTNSNGFKRRSFSSGPSQERHDPHNAILKSEKNAGVKTIKQIRSWQEEGSQKNEPDLDTNIDEMQLDPWQQAATVALFSNKNVIVDAPTTAGKTRVVEYYLSQHIHDPEFRACYTCPVKSLTNDKVREFRAMFGDEMVGISTGDIKENLSAPLVIATLESYRNSLIGVDPDLGRNLVIFDEYHFISDYSRGSAWEEAIILSPENCQILMLSASVGNSEDFKGWLLKIKKLDCEIIRVDKRPVPLVDMLWNDEDWVLDEFIDDRDVKKIRLPRRIIPLDFSKAAARILKLEEMNLTPCLVYVAQRRQCEALAAELRKKHSPLPVKEQDKLEQALAELNNTFQSDKFMNPGLKSMIIKYGIAYHHSGIAPPARIAIEHLVKDGLIRFCAATMGLSIGINFAVRATVVSDFQRPSDLGHVHYAQSEVLQMTGRAGRRGQDKVGFACWLSPAYYKKMAKAKREPCFSQLKNDPTTFLGLLSRNISLEGVEHIYNASLLKYQNKEVDLSLVTKKRVQKKLQSKELPCKSPAGMAFTSLQGREALCSDCHFQKECVDFVAAKLQGRFSQLHFHLNVIGAMTRDDELTTFGSIGRYFPQNGGLVLAKMLANGDINADNLVMIGEIIAALAYPRFKEIYPKDKYEPFWDVVAFEEKLEEFYPYELFPEYYDPPFGRRNYPVIKEYNPIAGYLFKQWIRGGSWSELIRSFDQNNFNEGDLMGLFFRIATYFQSIVSLNQGEISKNAKLIREDLLRDPLSLTI